MKKLIYLLVFVLTGLSGYSQPPCGSNPPAGNTCATATPICELNGYCGNTSASYTANSWSQSCGFLGLSDCGLSGEFCGSIENNSFLTFVASSSSISFDVWVYNSTYGDGIQIMIFSATNCSGTVHSYYCSQLAPSSSSQNVSASGLTPGNTYYIMIDGFAGDVCDYTFAANSGVAIPVDVTPSTATVCAGDPVNLTASGGNGTYSWNPSSTLSGTSGANVTATPTTPGTYTYTVNSAGGNPLCPSSSSATATITVNSCGGCTVTASNSGDVCEGTATFDLSASNVPGGTYSWTGPNGFTSSVQNPTGVPVPSTPGTYTYTVTATAVGAPCTATTTIIVNPCACTVTASNSGDVCEGTATFDLFASNVASGTYSWTGPNGFTSSVQNPVGVPVPSAAGTYTYTVTATGTGSPCTATTTLIVNPAPTATISGSTSLCSVANCTLTFTGTPNATITYNDGTSNQTVVLDASGNATVVVAPLTTTTYSLLNAQLTPPTGCSAALSGSATITLVAPPNANAGPDVSVCLNNAGPNQIGQTPVAGETYSWAPVTGLNNAGISNPTFSTATVGTTTYTLTVTTAGGCTSTSNVTVDILPLPPVSFYSDITVGCEPQTILFTNTSPGSTNCVWTFEGYGNQTSCGNVSIDYTSAGVFDVGLQITDANGCVNTFTNIDMITIYPNPVADFTISPTHVTVNNPYIETQNNSVNAANYIWEFGDGTTSGQTNPSHTYVDNAGSYTITLIASSGTCVDSTSITLEVADELIYFVPNSFTPDGDEYNNFFMPVFNSSFDKQSYTMMIFDRWGEIIFETHDLDVGWDGTYHGEMCKEGTYTWTIEIKKKTIDSRIELSGHINLIR